MQIGMTDHEFMHSTMKYVKLRIENYAKEMEAQTKRIEYQSWLTGLYVMNAISCSFNKHAKYPKNPIEVNVKDTKQMAKITGKSEEELHQEEMYMALLIRQANANIAKKKEELKQQEEQVS